MERSSGAAPPLSSGGSGEPEPSPTVSMQVERDDRNATVVVLAGELDLSSIPGVERQLLGQVGAKTGLVVDLTGVTFIDSSGIALLIRASHAVGEGGTFNVVTAPGSQVDRVFRLAGVAQALPVFDDRGAALEALSG